MMYHTTPPFFWESSQKTTPKLFMKALRLNATEASWVVWGTLYYDSSKHINASCNVELTALRKEKLYHLP